MEFLDLGAYHVGIWYNANQSASFLEAAGHVTQHTSRLCLILKSVVHAEHHRNHIESTSTPSRVPGTSSVESNLVHNRDIRNGRAKCILNEEFGMI